MLVSAISLGAACTHHHTVVTMAPLMPSSSATAELQDGRVIAVRAGVTPTGYRWFTEDGSPIEGGPGAEAVVDDAAIRSYVIVNRPRGMLEGALLGGLVGGAVGAVVGYAEGDDECGSDEFCLLAFSAEDKALLTGVLLSGVGFLAGGLLGFIAGSRDVYEPQPSYVPRVSPTVGPGEAGASLRWSF